MPQVRVLVKKTKKTDEEMKSLGFKWCRKDCRYERNFRKTTLLSYFVKILEERGYKAESSEGPS